MNFIFHQPTECNLHLVREFYANWDPSHPDHLLKVHEKVICFTAVDINELLGIPEANPNLLRYKVDEEELDYKPEVITLPVDITTARSTSRATGLILTMVERQTRTDKVLGRLYSLMMMLSTTGGRLATPEKLHAVKLDYPLGHHARTMLRIGLDFVEMVDDDIPTDEEHRYRDSNIESNEEDQSDDRANDDGDDIDGTTDNMTAIVPFE
ncbi:hypothetical protein BC332_02566 [Capsicum chinense]|nr:hypothetical protein BC332_02566 [Capsicum chinense]